MASSVNIYSWLDEQVKLKRSHAVQNKTSLNLYGALMMTKEDASKRESKNNSRIKELLNFSNKETLSELDKEKIYFTLDYLRIKWIEFSDLKNITPEDFAKIKSRKTASGRAEALIQVVIERYAETYWLSKDKTAELEQDIHSHVNSMIQWKNAEIGNKLAESLALKRLSANRFRHYAAKIKHIIEKNNWDISKCYMDIMKYANYSSMNLIKRSGTRYIIPFKFWWRNMHKQTQLTLDALAERSKSSKKPAEQLSINYILENLKLAYNHFKDTLWPSNADFDKVKSENISNIYNVQFNHKGSEYSAAA